MSNYFKHKMRSKNPATIAAWVILGIIAVVGFAILFGFIIMWLWNALLPDIFGLTEITYWQGVGIFILAKILFGGIGNSSGKHESKKKYKGHNKCENSNDSKNDFSKWELYDNFWKEEGDQAYQNYISRINGDDSEE